MSEKKLNCVNCGKDMGIEYIPALDGIIAHPECPSKNQKKPDKQIKLSQAEADEFLMFNCLTSAIPILMILSQKRICKVHEITEFCQKYQQNITDRDINENIDYLEELGFLTTNGDNVIKTCYNLKKTEIAVLRRLKRDVGKKLHERGHLNY